jgi:hypothetical protein
MIVQRKNLSKKAIAQGKKAKARQNRLQKILHSTYLHVKKTNQTPPPPERGGGVEGGGSYFAAVLPGGRNFGQKAQKGPGKNKVGRKNLWPNFGQILPKVAEKGQKKIF